MEHTAVVDSNNIIDEAAAADKFASETEEIVTNCENNNNNINDDMLKIANKLQHTNINSAIEAQTQTGNDSLSDDNQSRFTERVIGASNNNLSPHHSDLKRSKPAVLQRQRHTSDEEYQPPPDEADYAADLEENDDDDDDDDVYECVDNQRTLTPRNGSRNNLVIRQSVSNQDPKNDKQILPYNITKISSNITKNNSSKTHQPSSISASSLPKHIQFQMHKPHSTNALISTNAPSNMDKNALKHSSSVCSMSDSTTTPQSKYNPQYYRQRIASASGCRAPLYRDYSSQSDSSRYSSVDSLLESRKPDSEAILNNMFGSGSGSDDILSRIPKRFMKPSQVRGINTELFVKRIQLASAIAENSVLGYRGLTGNPDVPPSSIVAKIMQRFEVNQRKKSLESIKQTMR